MHFKLFLLGFVTSSVNSQLVKSLNSVLDYGIFNGIKNLSFLLGVAIAKGQLDILEKNVTDRGIKFELQALQLKCTSLLKEVNPDEDSLFLALCPTLWGLDSFPTSPLPTLNTSVSSVPPKGPILPGLTSDECIRSLLSHCHIPQMCVAAELPDTDGYQITHQVLYWTLYYQKCLTKVNNASKILELVKHKCALILQQRQKIMEMGFPSSVRDLYFEQMVVCGLYGFSEFYTPYDQSLLQSLQTAQGCFSTFNSREQVERECDDHLSGVATAVLGLMVKHHLSHAQY